MDGWYDIGANSCQGSSPYDWRGEGWWACCCFCQATQSSLVYLWTHLPSTSKGMECSAMSVEDLITSLKTAESLGRQGKVVKWKECFQWYAATSARTCCIKVSGKRGQGWEVSTTLSLHRLKEVLPVIKVQIDGVDRIALVNSSYSSSIVSGLICQLKTEAHHNLDGRLEVPFQPWCWKHHIRSDQQGSP